MLGPSLARRLKLENRVNLLYFNFTSMHQHSFPLYLLYPRCNLEETVCSSLLQKKFLFNFQSSYESRYSEKGLIFETGPKNSENILISRGFFRKITEIFTNIQGEKMKFWKICATMRIVIPTDESYNFCRGVEQNSGEGNAGDKGRCLKKVSPTKLRISTLRRRSKKSVFFGFSSC